MTSREDALPDTRVIAYFMHESEQADASAMLRNVQVTDSYAIGDIDETQIADLESKGLIVQPCTRARLGQHRRPSSRGRLICAVLGQAAARPRSRCR